MRGPDGPDGAPVHVTLPLYGSLKTRLQDGHEVILLESGDEYFAALERDIDAARSAIFVETYIFNDDPTGRRIARALANAYRRGVRVHLVVDGFGTPSLRGEVRELLAACPGAVAVFRPERHALMFDRRRLRRLHRKLAVIDSRIAFVGGINLLDDRFDPNHGELEAPRLDFAVRVRGPLVAHVNVAAQRLWHELKLLDASIHRGREPVEGDARWPGRGRARTGDLLQEAWAQARTVTSEVTPAGRIRAQFAVRDNFRHRRTIERWYLRRIAQAREDVLIANAYFLPGTRFRRALTLAAARGVRVRLLLQGRVEYRMQHYATQALYEQLLAAGVEIYEYRSSFLHAKVAVIDEHVTVGSSNIDPFSLLLAREANVFIADAEFAADLRERLDRAIRAGSAPVALDAYRRRRWYQRLLHAFAFALLRIFVSLNGERY
jgi:cardiolipin synthase